MATESQLALKELFKVDGVRNAFLIEAASGRCLVSAGASDSESRQRTVFYASRLFQIQKQFAEESCGTGEADQIMTVFENWYHLSIALPDCGARWFVHLTLDRQKANLALARHHLLNVIGTLSVRELDTTPVESDAEYDLCSLLTYGDDEELPPFMREDSVRRLLDMTDDAQNFVIAA